MVLRVVPVVLRVMRVVLLEMQALLQVLPVLQVEPIHLRQVRQADKQNLPAHNPAVKVEQLEQLQAVVRLAVVRRVVLVAWPGCKDLRAVVLPAVRVECRGPQRERVASPVLRVAAPQVVAALLVA